MPLQPIKFVTMSNPIDNSEKIETNNMGKTKGAEKSLQDNQTDLKRAQAVTHTGSWRLDTQHNALLWSDEAYAIFGIPKGTPMTHESFLDTIHPSDKEYVDNKWNAALRGEPYDIKHRIIVGNEVKWVHEKAELEFDESGLLLSGFGTVQDITERKKMEKELRETSEYLESLLNYANAPIIVWDSQFKINRFNNAFERLTGRSKDEVIGKELNILFPDEEIMKHIKRTMTGERWEAFEIPILDLNGLERTVLWNSANIYDTDGKITATIAQGQDITERKKAEEVVAKSLKEKELLLKEVNHRVKNNLQLISSLLHLQQLEANKETASMLKESQNRIKSIGLVHEILYQTKDFSQINVNHYLRELVKRTLNTYDAKKISVKFDIEEIPLKINAAISCGLIVNELIINAFKHAFPNNKGNINLSLKSKNDMIELAIADNGIGMPDNFSLENTSSLGLKLVKSLSEQLEGKLDYTVENGTTFKVTFPNS